MNKFYSLRICVMLAGAALAMVACDNPDGAITIPKDCESSSSGKVLCVPTFHDLAANPKGYDGQEIIVSGYLVVDRGALSLYSNDLDYKHMLFQGNVIIVRAAEPEQKRMFDRFGYSYVRMRGVFHKSTHLPPRKYEIGDIRVLGDVTKLPDRTDPGKREGWSDIMIDVRDISK